MADAGSDEDSERHVTAGSVDHRASSSDHQLLQDAADGGLILEATAVGDIDSKRMMVHVYRGKGAKHRYIPLPESTLRLMQPSRFVETNFRGPRVAGAGDFDRAINDSDYGSRALAAQRERTMLILTERDGYRLTFLFPAVVGSQRETVERWPRCFEYLAPYVFRVAISDNRE